MKRIFDLTHHDFMTLDKQHLLDTIKTSEGRTIMAETVVSVMPLLDGVSNAETASAFGADLITLNTFNFEQPFIFGYDDQNFNMFGGISQIGDTIKENIEKNINNPTYIKEFKSVVGRFIGVNMEPVPLDITYPNGMRLSVENLKKAKALGFDYIVITANPKTGVKTENIVQGIKLARKTLGDDILIIAGKMHGAGAGNIYDEKDIENFALAGADVILFPAPGTVPGFDLRQCQKFVTLAHKNKVLAMTTIGTSQEGADATLIEKIGYDSKMSGADIHHIGDAGFSGMAHPENIMMLSNTVRGKRHTYRQISRSKRR